MIEYIVIDDDHLAIELLNKFMLDFKDFELAKAFLNPIEALIFIQKKQPDVVFLDLEMPGLNGFELAGKLDKSIPIVFTTADPNAALQSFNHSTVDYLLKPYSKDRFSLTIEKLRKYLKVEIDHSDEMKQELTFRSGKKFWNVRAGNIIYIESIGEYFRVLCKDQQIIALGSIKNLIESTLPKTKFLQIHKSYIVNITQVKNYTSQYVTMNNDAVIPIGRKYKPTFKELFSNEAVN